MSIGGLLPVEKTCVACGAYSSVVEAGTRDFRVIGYFTTFARGTTIPPSCFNAIGALGARVGDYEYNCFSPPAPGVDGAAPYFVTGTTVTVRRNFFDSTLTLFPRAVRADGKGSAGCSFIGNTASVGGAISLNSAASNVFVMDSTFVHNRASVGGAVAARDSNSGVYFYSSTFIGNRASAGGGALALLTSNVGIQLYDCVFRQNTAQYGGALYALFFNGFSTRLPAVALVLANATFAGNAALADGGAVYAGSYNTLSISNSRIVSNSAGRRGGGLFAGSGNNSVKLDATTFTSNRAQVNGSAVSLRLGNNINLASTGKTPFISNCRQAAGSP